MFGNINDTRSKTEDNRSIETCYGGFGGRFSYEQCRRESSRSHFMRIIPKATVIITSCLFLGLLGTVCAVLIFNIVQDNRTLYYPNTSALESTRVDDNLQIANLEATSATSNVSFIQNVVAAENVSIEESRRYRIPTGVMVHEVTENSAPHIAGMCEGDIIVAFDNIEVTDVAKLNYLITSYERGTAANITVFRNNEYINLTVNIE